MRAPVLLLAILGASPVMAAPPMRELCSARPGLNSPTCTVEPGHFQLETAAADFARERDGSARTDTLLLADSLVRIGLSERSEAQIAWTPHVSVRTRDRSAGDVERASGAGDVALGFSRALRSGEKGPSMAITASLSLPVGRRSVSAGTWGLTLVLPVSFDLSESVHLNATPEIDAAPDADGDGRHLAIGTAAGLTLDLAEALALNLEAAAFRDDDPAGHTTQAVASTSLAWTAGRDLAFDAGVIVGLNRPAPRHELYAGFTRRF